MSKRVVRIRMTSEFILEKLGFPITSHLERVSHGEVYGSFELVISSPDVPDVVEGGVIPLVNPIVTTVTEHFDWNVED